MSLETAQQELARLNRTRFDEWMRRVDAEIDAMCSLTSGDLPDCCYHDWWEDGVTPKSAAKKAIRNADDF